VKEGRREAKQFFLASQIVGETDRAELNEKSASQWEPKENVFLRDEGGGVDVLILT